MMNARSALSDLKHQKEKRNMDYFAGLDVSVKETSVCIVDGFTKMAQEHEQIAQMIEDRRQQVQGE
jgi:lipopolysaccharide biosynthesis regulator YciM